MFKINNKDTRATPSVNTGCKHGNIIKKRKNDSDFSIVTIRRVPIIFFELAVVKNFMQIF